MTPELAHMKLAAYLHDPPHKPLVLGRGAGHEAYAERIRKAFGLEGLLDDAERRSRTRLADHLAAAADRPNFPGNVTADFWRSPALSHPLARHTPEEPSIFQLAALPGDLDPEAVTRGVERAASLLRGKASGDPVRLYLLLWRYFPEYLRAGEASPESGLPPEQRLGLLWHVLPADTRVPDHSVWDHLAVTAAIAGTLPEPAFLTFSLGPVQGFIAQARTTRDLWAGSYLLSYVAWQAMRVLCEEFGPDCVIYPALRGQTLVDRWLESAMGVEPPPAGARAGVQPDQLRVASLPNKFLALVPAREATALAKRAESAARAAWDEIGADVCGWLQRQSVPVDQPVWQDQIAQHLETFWTVLPWPAAASFQGAEATRSWMMRSIEPWLHAGALGEFWRAFDASARNGRYEVNAGSVYAPLHGLAQRLFDAGKVSRPFVQVRELGYKCTLCGERQPALGGEADFEGQRARWEEVARTLAGDLRDEGRERLCALCLTKRLAARASRLGDAAGGEPAFPSTSTLAALPTIRWLIERCEALPALDDFLAGIELVQEEVRHGAPIEAALSAPPRALPALEAAAAQLRGAARRRAEGLLRVDGEWLFDETYQRHLRAAEGGPAGLRDALLEARAALALVRAQAKSTEQTPGPRLSPFYAILMLDGDHLGRWVSGAQHRNGLADLLHPEALLALRRSGGWEEALAARRLFGPSTHAALSGALLAFSRLTVPYLVESEGQGRLVYAGGDDVLAFLPLDQALKAADELRRAYARAYALVHTSGRVIFTVPPGSDARTEWRIERHLGSDATASAGIAFVHHLYPLGAALEGLRRWAREAKDVHGRNAFQVGVIRRSGPDLTFGGNWALLEPLLRAQGAFAAGVLPQRTPYLVRELAASGADELDAGERRSLLCSILRPGERREEADRLTEWLIGVWEGQLQASLSRLADFLMLARFLGQEVGSHAVPAVP